MKKKCFAADLLLCLFLLFFRASVLAEALEQNLYADWLWEPIVEQNDTLSTGQMTSWACISFGAYPQTEIVSAPSAAVDDYAMREGDFLEDLDLD